MILFYESDDVSGEGKEENVFFSSSGEIAQRVSFLSLKMVVTLVEI